MAEEMLAAEQNCYSLGELIHNDDVVQHLRSEGLTVVDGPEQIPQGASVIIRSHGVSRAEFEAVQHTGVTVYDATCPKVKRTAGGVITGTPERASLTAIQTPQVFQADLIKAALTNAMRKHLAITDDCSAVEQLRVKPVVTQGSDENLKITTPIDIELAESILRRRGGA